MIFYFAVAVIFLACMVLDSKDGPLRPLLRVFALSLFVGVAGLRYQTGYDWMAYEKVFLLLNAGQDLVSLIVDVQMEPTFIFFCALLHKLGGGLQLLFFMVAAFNTYAICKYLSLTKGALLFGIFMYFCWVYLPVQMGVVRQSIGCSLVFLSICFLNNQKKHIALLCVLLASTFQVSLIIFVILFLPFVSVVIKKAEGLIIFFACLAIILKIDASYFLLSFISKIGIGFVTEKISGYMQSLNADLSVSSTFYFIFNLCLYFLFKKKSVVKKAHPFEFNILLVFLCLQGLAWAFPLGWNRIQYVAVLIQARMLYVYMEDIDYFDRLIGFLGAIAFSFFVLFWQLKNSELSPFVPYKSYINYLVYGDDGNGRINTENYYINFEKMMNEKAGSK